MQQVRATNLDDAFWTFDPFAVIRPSDPWYVPLEQYFDREHWGFVLQLERRLTPKQVGPDFVQLGVVGHRGSGKTTQVRQVVESIADHQVRAVFIDALVAFDQSDLTFSDLLLVFARSVLEALVAAGAELPGDEAEHLRSWFADELLEESHSREILGSVTAEAKARGGIPFIAELAAKLTATLKSDNVYRRSIRQRAERDAGDLLRRMNLLLDKATEALAAKVGGCKKLILVVDNLEKLVDRQKVDAAVLRRAEEIRGLRCDLVLFFDPADQYAPHTVQAGQAFDVITVPMMPIRERNDQPERVSDEVHRATLALLERRVELDKVFSDPPACATEIARLSGGRVRDVFHLARYACESIGLGLVTPEEVKRAAAKLVGERTVLAKPEHWPRLAEIHRDKKVANRPEDSDLLLHSLVLNYDGMPWWDVHPLVRLDSSFGEAWRKLPSL